MKSAFRNYIQTNALLEANEKVLLAVSGGIDSMVMLHLFLKLDYPIAIAHCNFHLRGEESDGDQELVAKFADLYGIKCYCRDFDTLNYSHQHKVSIQMAARELRYGWFKELQQTEGFSKIAIAHNANDQIETFFLNLLRGTGLEGLTGMAIKDHSLIRPLMFASRKQIEEYSSIENVPFREDSSNRSVKYARNKIRHVVIPAFESIRPAFQDRMDDNMAYISEANNFIQSKIKEIEREVFTCKGDVCEINIERLSKEESPEFVLFMLLQAYGFKGSIIKQIAASMQAPSGRTFYSNTHSLIKDRSSFKLRPLSEQAEGCSILAEETFIEYPIKMQLNKINRDNTFRLSTNPNVAQLDADRLVFPLTIRKWKAGDSFIPLGMKGRKKLSDFFIDQKIDLTEKQHLWVLESGVDIVWIVGHRIHDHYKITPATKNILVVEFI